MKTSKAKHLPNIVISVTGDASLKGNNVSNWWIIKAHNLRKLKLISTSNKIHKRSRLKLDREVLTKTKFLGKMGP